MFIFNLSCMENSKFSNQNITSEIDSIKLFMILGFIFSILVYFTGVSVIFGLICTFVAIHKCKSLSLRYSRPDLFGDCKFAFRLTIGYIISLIIISVSFPFASIVLGIPSLVVGVIALVIIEIYRLKVWFRVKNKLQLI